MMIPEKAYQTPIQIRFIDIDALGHVNNATQVTYLEIARVAYFEHLMKSTIDWDKEGIILAKVNIAYKTPILLADKLSVHIWCSNIGRKSFDLAYAITKLVNDTQVLASTATTTQVCFSYQEKKSISIPPTWKEKLNAHLFSAFTDN